MIQFLSSSKLCEVLVTHGLVDVEPCVKASAILSLSSVVTNPPLAKVFMQQRSDQFVSMRITSLDFWLELFTVWKALGVLHEIIFIVCYVKKGN